MIASVECGGYMPNSLTVQFQWEGFRFAAI
jgi:hypothetical protein